MPRIVSARRAVRIKPRARRRREAFRIATAATRRSSRVRKRSTASTYKVRVVRAHQISTRTRHWGAWVVGSTVNNQLSFKEHIPSAMRKEIVSSNWRRAWIPRSGRWHSQRIIVWCSWLWMRILRSGLLLLGRRSTTSKSRGLAMN